MAQTARERPRGAKPERPRRPRRVYTVVDETPEAEDPQKADAVLGAWLDTLPPR